MTCPDCPQTLVERKGGLWCPGCQGWLVTYPRGESVMRVIARPYRASGRPW